jgi:hypothetical protein
MSEGFLTRWSRRKREAGEADGERLTPQPDESTVPDNEAQAAREKSARENLAPSGAATDRFDPADLPPIESIEAGSDIRAFLRPGVPAALSRAALRRAWSADPAIRDFVGLAENSWDFTKPETVPGFASTLLPEEAKRLLAHFTREEPARSCADDVAASKSDDARPDGLEREENNTSASQARPETVPTQIAAVQQQEDSSKDEAHDAAAPRHGAALPE